MNFTKAVLVACSASAVLGAATNQDVMRLMSAAPVRFEPAGAPGTGRFVARGLRYRFQFENNRATLHVGDSAAASLVFAGANPRATLHGVDRLASTTTSLLGSDRSQWRDNIPNFARLKADSLYSGIDLVYYGTASDLEYDLQVKPGADARQIRLRFDGTRMLRRDPVAYQIAPDGSKSIVKSGYRRNGDGSFGFVLGPYDHSRELVIDPTLTMSAYLAGSAIDRAAAIGRDSKGLLYIGGTTSSTDFPSKGSSQQPATGGGKDVFIAVLDPTAAAGNQVVYTTYYGGSGQEVLTDMVVSGNGIVYATGSTNSADLPMVNAYQTSLGGLTDAFVMKLNPSQGTSGLSYSTYLGGASADQGNGITVDSGGSIYVVGTTQSSAFPTADGFQTTLAGMQDAFMTILNPSKTGASTIAYSTLVGGTSYDYGQGIALAPDGTVWIVGGTYSSDFPIAGYAYRYSYIAGGDAFAVQIKPSLGSKSEVYGTYLGGSGADEAKKVVVNSKGRVIMAGYTLSSDLPLTSNAMQAVYGGDSDIFVAILDPSIQTGKRSDQLVYTTYFGGSLPEVPYSLKEDSSGNVYVTGFTMSPDMTVSTNALDPTYDNSLDGFVLIFNPSTAATSGPMFASYLGSGGSQIATGITFDSKGTVYVTGYTSGGIFDQLGGVPNSKENGTSSAFVMGFKP